MKNIAKLNEFFTFLKSKDYFYEFYESMDFKPSSGDISKLMKGKYDDYKFITEKVDTNHRFTEYINIEDVYNTLEELLECITSEYNNAVESLKTTKTVKNIKDFYFSPLNETVEFNYTREETDESYLKRTNINLMVSGLLKLKDKILDEYSMFIENYDSIKNDMEKLSLEEKIKKLQSELDKMENK